MKQTIASQLTKLCNLEELPLQVGKNIVVGDHDLAVFRLRNGQVKTVENKCPHKQGPLAEGMVSGEYVFCPLHDWKIDLTTGDVQKPDDGCVRSYPVKVIDGEVYIEL